MVNVKNFKRLFASAAVGAAMLCQSIPAFAAQSSPTLEKSSGTTYYVTDFGANGSDKKDDSEAIQKALNMAKSSNKTITVKIPKGNYYIKSHLRIYSGTYLKLSSGAHLYRQNDDDYLLINGIDESGAVTGYKRTTNITIEGGIWDGNVSNTTRTRGLFKINNAKNVKILNTKFTNCCGTHFVQLNGVANATIQNVKFTNFIDFTGTAASYKSQVGADYTYRGTEALHLDFVEKNSSTGEKGTPCKNVTVTDCTFKKVTTGIGTHHVYDYMSADNIQIIGNTFKDCWYYCVDTASYTNFVMKNNTATNTGGLIYAERTSGKITGNKITAKTKLSGKMYSHDNFNGRSPYLNTLRISNKSKLTVTKNTIKNSTENCIYVCDNAKVTIKNNTISGAVKNGICVSGATVTQTGNTIKNCKGKTYLKL